MEKRSDIKKLLVISMLGTISFLLMLLEIPLWFAPPFYEIDFSEVAVLVGGFAYGPLAAIMIESIKIILNLIFTGTITMGVGELGNFLIGLSFVLPAVFIYRRNKTRKNAIIGLLVGTISLSIFGAVLNGFLLLPAYAYFMSLPIEAFIGMGSAANSLVNNMFTLILFAVVPFNLLKGILTSIVVILIYKRVSVLIKAKDMVE